MRATVICHFWNNEWILPYWLRHHTRLFDHGILIDHGSTDNSVAVIRRFAPDWEVRPTQACKEAFIAADADREVMEVEEEVTGWKMVLNVTEFVLHHDLKGYIRALPPKVRGVTTSGVVLVESPAARRTPLTDEPLFFQKTWGYFEYELGKRPEDYGMPAVWRSRLLHDFPNGDYEVGRHVTRVPHIHDPNLFLVWAGWAPFEALKQMKLAVQTRIPKSEFERGFSVQHFLPTEKALEDRLVWYQGGAHDLLRDRYYAATLDRLRRFGYRHAASRPVSAE